MNFETKVIPSIIILTTGFVTFILLNVTSSKEFFSVLAFVFISVLSYFSTDIMIPMIKPLTLKADMFGMDINKKGKN